MKHFKIKKGLLLLSVILLFTAGCSKDKDYKFTFNRVDGETYKQKLSITKKRDMGPAGIRIDDTLSETMVTCKKTNQGWDIASKPIKRIMMRNGEEVENPLLDLLKDFTITYKVDKDGKLADVKGYEAVLEAIKKQYSPSVAETLATTLDAETLKERERSEWNGRIGIYINTSFSIGDVWEEDAPIKLQNGADVVYKVKTRFKELTQVNNTTCVVIEQTYDSTGEGLADWANEVADSVSKEADKKEDTDLKASKGGSSIKGNLTRVIDPATMNIYKEEGERIIRMEMEFPGMGKIPVVISETRSYEYEYGK